MEPRTAGEQAWRRSAGRRRGRLGAKRSTSGWKKWSAGRFMRRASPRGGVVALGWWRRGGVGCGRWGQGVAIAKGLAPRQAIQPVDRRVSNPQRMREDVARCGVRVVVATRTARLVNGEWTEWQDAAQARL